MNLTNTGLLSPYLLGQASAQAGQQGVEETEVWQPHFFPFQSAKAAGWEP